MSFISKHIIKPVIGLKAVPVLPSFKEQSSPDWSFSALGLKVGGHSDGLPIYLPAYITISHRHDAPLSPVPEPASALLLALGIAAVFLLRRRRPR